VTWTSRIQINVTGGSHHIHLYRPYDSTLDLPDHTEVCNMAVDFDKWALVVATQLRKTDWELPEGVAYHFRAGEQILIQTHFVNVGSLETKGEGKVLMNSTMPIPARSRSTPVRSSARIATSTCRRSATRPHPPSASSPRTST
jgi:hypothetical protein